MDLTAFSVLAKVLPKTPRGDYWFALAAFMLAHHRFPRAHRLSLNDQLFRLKVTGELENPLRTYVTDKEFVKQYVAMKLGESYNVPTIAVLRDLASCRNYHFPHRCVIKPTHLSGEVILRKHGEALDILQIESWFGRSFYEQGRERNYLSLSRKVIVEQFVFDDHEPADYKIFCVKGKPRVIQVDSQRHTAHQRNFYTADWLPLSCSLAHPPGPLATAPANLEDMLRVAERLSRDFEMIRVDTYSNGRRVYVGELTNCHGNALERFDSPAGEREFSQALFG
jgi:hypothetical protein